MLGPTRPRSLSFRPNNEKAFWPLPLQEPAGTLESNPS